MAIRRSASAESVFTPTATFAHVKVCGPSSCAEPSPINVPTPAEFIRSQPFDITASEVMRRAAEAGVRPFTPGLVYNTRTYEKLRQNQLAKRAERAASVARVVDRELVGYMVRLPSGQYLGGAGHSVSWVMAYRYLPNEQEHEYAQIDAKKWGGRVVRVYRRR